MFVAIANPVISALMLSDAQRAMLRYVQTRYPLAAISRMAQQVDQIAALDYRPHAAAVAQGIALASRRR